MKLDTFLHKIYFDCQSKTLFSSINNLYKAEKSKYPDVTLEKIKDWQDVYTLHKPARKKKIKEIK